MLSRLAGKGISISGPDGNVVVESVAEIGTGPEKDSEDWLDGRTTRIRELVLPVAILGWEVGGAGSLSDVPGQSNA